MDKNTLRSKVKRRLGIKEDETQFDADIDDFVQESVASLFPIVQKEIAPEDFDLPAGENTFNLITPDVSLRIKSIRRLEIYDPSNDTWNPTDEYTQHGSQILLYESFHETKKIRVYGLGPHSYADLPIELIQVVINWAISEFYSMLVGDKRKYNIYTQSNGARSVDNFSSTSQFYLDRGNQLLADRANIRGQ